jgi:hypothetical protein
MFGTNEMHTNNVTDISKRIGLNDIYRGNEVQGQDDHGILSDAFADF